jgi:hypothetical protein
MARAQNGQKSRDTSVLTKRVIDVLGRASSQSGPQQIRGRLIEAEQKRNANGEQSRRSAARRYISGSGLDLDTWSPATIAEKLTPDIAFATR